MSNEVTTVGDLSGKHVGTSKVSIFLLGSEIVGVITELSVTTEYVSLLSGEQYGEASAYIDLENGIELNSVPLSTPASIVERSDPQRHTDTPDFR